MKLVRNLAAALVLACALTVNVYAGDQPTPAVATPPPTNSETVITDKTTITSQNDGKATTSQQEEPIDLLTQAIVALLSMF